MDEYRVEYPYIAQPFRQRPLESPFLEMPYQGTAPGHDHPAFRPMTKEERDEARRIAVEASFNFDGYQVVRREFAGSRFDPVLTIREKSITFNKACISKLDHVVYVQLLINPEKKTLAIRPCEEGARDAIRWCIPKDDDRKSREIRCDIFTAKVYEMMGWQTFYHYKLQGMRINYRGEQLYVFDLKAGKKLSNLHYNCSSSIKFETLKALFGDLYVVGVVPQLHGALDHVQAAHLLQAAVDALPAAFHVVVHLAHAVLGAAALAVDQAL